MKKIIILGVVVTMLVALGGCCWPGYGHDGYGRGRPGYGHDGYGRVRHGYGYDHYRGSGYHERR